MKKHSSGVGAMLTKTESSGADSFLQELRSHGDNTYEKAAVKLYDHTPITYLLSTSLASCNLKIRLRRFVSHIIRHNNQFSMQ